MQNVVAVQDLRFVKIKVFAHELLDLLARLGLEVCCGAVAGTLYHCSCTEILHGFDEYTTTHVVVWLSERQIQAFVRSSLVGS